MANVQWREHRVVERRKPIPALAMAIMAAILIGATILFNTALREKPYGPLPVIDSTISTTTTDAVGSERLSFTGSRYQAEVKAGRIEVILPIIGKDGTVSDKPIGYAGTAFRFDSLLSARYTYLGTKATAEVIARDIYGKPHHLTMEVPAL